ncbi:2-hydroxychromene-2-carboxylate isomerase [Brucella gallinifaecis]|uniref:2-hydroxychromene-2-carboxylate isomerase n=1 Tax=Brucella gallinifaecis TaxID=215590 RepID=UPI00235FF4FA|nr:DsbA family protein [Brucella gallinifaecis]
MTKNIDYFFGIGSPWAYIGQDLFKEIAARHGASIRPMLIPLVEENGGIYSKNRPDARRNYWLKDLKRWAFIRGKTLNFENRAALSDPTSAAFVIIAAQLQGLDWLKLTDAYQLAFWSHAQDIGNSKVRQKITTEAGFDATKLEILAKEEDVQALWKANYTEAKEAGVFGFPTFRYEDELYWGQDSLPFLELHIKGEKIET